ncbi:Imm1 family immunity protein [Micromonospora sp. NPDC007220]|uniref:Imm1 family immunity protein n=1 Tax=Micromonospora sp. NPDC007220 TaxID=3154318 RepID=UPI0033FE6FD4
MILSVSSRVFDESWRHATTLEEKARLVALTMDRLPSDDLAWFGIADRRVSYDDLASDTWLAVAVNKTAGYGALMWCVDSSSPRRGGIYEHVWLTDNPSPPKAAPQVVANPDAGLIHSPRSTLPIPQIRLAVEEFCYGDTGDRPERVSWARGDLNGHRHD